MLFMFVTADGEDIGRRVFRRAQNVIKSEGTETEITEVIKKRIEIYLKEIFHRK